MSDLHPGENGPDLRSSSPSTESLKPEATLFASREQETGGGRSMLAVGTVAAVVLLAVLGVVLLMGRSGHKALPNGPQELDVYAGSLAISGVVMSESSSLSAVKVTYIDGMIRNSGMQTVRGATVQVLFGNDEQLPPQIETLPLTLIRTHEPYVDTEPVSADPLQPGQQREFRLIFENIVSNWNQQIPEIRVIRVR